MPYISDVGDKARAVKYTKASAACWDTADAK
jgi:hypothetical protein